MSQPILIALHCRYRGKKKRLCPTLYNVASTVQLTVKLQWGLTVHFRTAGGHNKRRAAHSLRYNRCDTSIDGLCHDMCYNVPAYVL